MDLSCALIGSSKIIKYLKDLLAKAAQRSTPLLITGEIGTGKYAIAHAIYSHQTQSADKFFYIPCNKYSSELLEHEIELVCKKNNCTIYIDNIDILTQALQKKLLAILNDNDPLLSTRFIFSSSIDLSKLVVEKSFINELFEIISISSIDIPPLRERNEDIPAIVEFLIQKFNRLKSKKITGISKEASSALLQHNWQYNLHELENLVERIVIFKNNGNIEIYDLPPKFRNLFKNDINEFAEKKLSYIDVKSPAILFKKNISLNKSIKLLDDLSNGIDNFIKNKIDLGSGIDFYHLVEEFENKLLEEAMRRTNYNKNKAAQLLSMKRTTLVEKLKKRHTMSIGSKINIYQASSA